MGNQPRAIRYAEGWKGTIMARVNYGNVLSRQGAIKRAKAAGVSARGASQWWDIYGQPAQELTQSYQRREAGAREANLARETEIRGTYDELIGRSEGGGAFRTAGLADIKRGKRQAIGAGTQQMISSGLYGTTTAASIPVQAENQASLQRLKLEGILEQRTSALKLGKAGFVERIEQPYPDYSMLMNAMAVSGRSL